MEKMNYSLALAVGLSESAQRRVFSITLSPARAFFNNELTFCDGTIARQLAYGLRSDPESIQALKRCQHFRHPCNGSPGEKQQARQKAGHKRMKFPGLLRERAALECPVCRLNQPAEIASQSNRPVSSTYRIHKSHGRLGVPGL